MKSIKIIFAAAIAGAIAFVSGQAAASPLQVSFSATIIGQNTNAVSQHTDTSKTSTLSFNSAKMYELLSNAVVNAAANGTGITSVHLPTNGYIAFNPNGNDGNVQGTFYVTNKSGFYYPLSGLDTNGSYYSFAEFDAYSPNTDNTNSMVGSINFGFSDNFNGVESGTFSTSTGAGSESIKSTGLFYAHDDPYSFGDGNNANAFYSNVNALEVRGIAHITLNFKAGAITSWSVSLSGVGNAVINNSQNDVITAATVSSSSQ